MAFISGKTFGHKETLKRLGAIWDGNRKGWKLSDNSPALDTVRNLIGCVVTLDGKEPNKMIPAPRENVRPAAVVTTSEEIKTRFIGDDQTHLGTFRPTTVFAGFSSLPAYVDFVKSVRVYGNGENGRGAAWGTSAHRHEFTGTDDFDHAVSIARNGWEEGVDTAKQALEFINGEQATARESRYGVAGGRVNVGKMLAGSPVHMKARVRMPAKKIVTLFTELGMSANINPKTIAIRAACVGAISDLLEQNGYSTEIVVTISSRMDVSMINAVTLKQPGDPLNLNDLVFGLGHPSMLRRFYFATVASCDDLTTMNSGSYGSPMDAFSDEHEVPVNAFMLDRLNENTYGTLEQRISQTFETIIPDNFPVTLK